MPNPLTDLILRGTWEERRERAAVDIGEIAKALPPGAEMSVKAYGEGDYADGRAFAVAVPLNGWRER